MEGARWTFVRIRYTRTVRQTHRARLVAFRGGQEAWIPEALIRDDEGATMRVPDWLVDEKDLEEHVDE